MSVEAWVEEQDEHAMACTIYGDCIYDLVQEGALQLETAWRKTAKGWLALADAAIRTGFLGLGTPLVSRSRMLYLLFTPTLWPEGLTVEERKLLRFLGTAARYNPLYAQGVKKVDLPDPEPGTPGTSKEALSKLALLTKKKLFAAMRADYQVVSETYGKKIAPLCDSVYDEPCSFPEGEAIFKGDLRRGWKAKTLNVEPATYATLRAFFDLVTPGR